MKKHLLIIVALIFGLSNVKAQTIRTVSGTVADSSATTLPGVSVKLRAGADSLATSTDADGKFKFNTSAQKITLTVSGIGYKTQTREFTLANGDVTLQPIIMQYQINILNVVTITAIKPPIIIKQDTVEYNAAAYKVREGSQVEDLLKKLPGVNVDKDGNVEGHGKPITKVRVNGKDYFKGDVQAATQNLPADIVENIQIIDDFGDQANLTGIKTGEPEKILNITIKKNRNKWTQGQATAGAGNDGRYLLRFSGTSFNEGMQIGLIGNLNNNNSNAFNFRGGNGNGGSNANGITTSRSIGLNFRDDLGKKVTLYGNYSFSSRDREATSVSFQQELYRRDTILRNNSSNNNSGGDNHRFDFNLEYKIDTLNYLKVNPEFSYSSNNSLNNSSFTNSFQDSIANNADSVIRGTRLSRNNSTSPSGGINVLYNHRFRKKGRNFSINSGYSYNNNGNQLEDDYITIQDNSPIPLFQQISTNNSTARMYSNLSYTEPIGATTYLELGYNFNRNNNNNTRLNYRVDPETGETTYVDSLSTNYNYQFITNRVSLNLRGVKEKYNYTVGLAAQPTTLEGEFRGNTLTTNTFNWIPTARFVYKFQQRQSFTFNYSGSNNQPNFTQLQPEPDLSNPENRVYGNPNLKPEFINNFSLNYNQFDLKSGNSLFAGLNFNQTNNKIVNNNPRPTLDSTGRLIRETRFVNTDGFYTVNGNYTLSKPFAERKFTVSLNGNLSYNNNITFIEGQRSKNQNYTLTQGVKLRTDIDSIMDTEISTNYTLNSTRFGQQSLIDANIHTWVIGLDGRNFFGKHLILGYNFSKAFNRGYSSSVRANPTLLSAYVEYQFLKRNLANFRFQGFDLFNQNTGLSRTASGNIISESRTNRLGRY
ncbi:MAG: hypothetical protein EOP46_02285, partial [Sphingobacteriaceae bacterium]